MSGKIIYRPHTCNEGRPDATGEPNGTIWECECGKQFERVLSGRLLYPMWGWINAPENPKKKRWCQS